MEIEEIPAKYIKEVKKYSSAANHERNAYRLSEAVGVRIRPGNRTSVIPGPPVTIILEARLLGPVNNDAIRHELAHVFMWWSRIEEQLIEEYGCLELALPMIERLCQAAVLFLKAPQPIVNRAVRQHGVSAKAVRYVQKTARITAQEALYRVIYDDPTAARAGVITSGNYIADMALCNFRLPFWFCDRVPEITQLSLPEGSRATFCKGTSHRQLIGVYTA